MKRGGYVALYRSVFDDEELNDERFSRREAWIWLFTMAAWGPSTHTVGRNAVKVERGQMATTLRTLAKTWGWPLSRVRRFLDYLRKAKRIDTQTLALADTPPGTPQAVLCIVVSVCNYTQFQTAKNGKTSHPAHPPALKQQKNLPFVYVLKPEEPNKRIEAKRDFEGQGKREVKRAISAGQRSKHGTIFIPLDHPQYQEFATDYRDAIGHAPKAHDGGNWFWPMGEAARPQHLLHLRPKPDTAEGQAA